MGVVRKLAILLSAMTWLCVIAVLVLSVRLSVVQVLSESMLPTLEVGDNVLAEKCKAKDVKEGDIIVYYSDRLQANIIHRVVDRAYSVENDGTLVFKLTTKGDNNLDVDIEPVSDENDIRKVFKDMPVDKVNSIIRVVKSPLGYVTLALLLMIGPFILTSSKDNKQKRKKESKKMSFNSNYDEVEKVLGGKKEYVKPEIEDDINDKVLEDDDSDTSEDGWRTRFSDDDDANEGCRQLVVATALVLGIVAVVACAVLIIRKIKQKKK